MLFRSHEQAGRYYGDEASYRATLEAPPHSALARWQWPSDVPADCGWVVEDHRVRRGPVRSHFNLLQPSEVAQLRGSAGCLPWCKAS